jgi:ribosome-binding protein aMBF1 (putative translation factor)
MDRERDEKNPEGIPVAQSRAEAEGNSLESIFVSSGTGARIRKAREDSGLTQSDLAGMINASQAQVDHYEHGGLDMPIARLFDMAEVLGTTAADLLAD